MPASLTHPFSLSTIYVCAFTVEMHQGRQRVKSEISNDSLTDLHEKNTPFEIRFDNFDYH